MSRCIFLLAGIFAFVLGFAQCPDSVRVYVNPEVICPGEIAHLSTDSILCTNIGDIICVHNDYNDTVIVSPSDWTRLNLSSTYTPLSVVFYVDETCQHGWAVEARNTAYEKKKWSVAIPRQHSIIDEPSLNNFETQIASISDLNGYSNTNNITQTVSNYTTYNPAFSLQNPYYLPAMGQLNVLFSVKDRVTQILTSVSRFSLPDDDYYWWSSTENNTQNAWAINNSSTISAKAKNTDYYVIPVMNF